MSRGSRKSKKELVYELGQQFRVNGINDLAFDQVTADRLGISRTDLNCIDVIERHGGVTAGELARESGLTTGAVTGVIDRLEEKGLVRRTRDTEDRRRVKIEVTPKLTDVAGQVYGPMMAEWDEIMSKPSAELLEAMIELMREANEVKPRHIERVRRGD